MWYTSRSKNVKMDVKFIKVHAPLVVRGRRPVV